jgi:hypothetical protein
MNSLYNQKHQLFQVPVYPRHIQKFYYGSTTSLKITIPSLKNICLAVQQHLTARIASKSSRRHQNIFIFTFQDIPPIISYLFYFKTFSKFSITPFRISNHYSISISVIQESPEPFSSPFLQKYDNKSMIIYSRTTTATYD